MSYLKFDKKQLVNLEYSLQREILHTNRAGSYSCTTLAGCNTRKYHGLLICPVYSLDGGKHVLLSSLDATVIQHDEEFNLGIHKYQGENYEPKGHKYIRDFETDIIPVTTYRVGGVVLTREIMMVEETEQVLVRYTLTDAHSPTKLRFKPFLAFRNVHSLSHSNLYANTKYQIIEHGIKIRLYEGYPELHLQFSKEAEYIANPDWYFNIEYMKEKNRGYDYLEDLFVPGYFELEIKKGESIVFSGATFEADPSQLKRRFQSQVKNKTPRNSFFNSLQNAAEQFVVKTPAFTDILAGYPWYNGRINQTFVALPGLSLALNNPTLIRKIIDTNVTRLKDGLFPKKWGRFGSDYDSADAPLWFFWSLQNLSEELGGDTEVWKNYRNPMNEILQAYRNGTHYTIHMLDNGLIHADATGVALTWMNAYADGKPVTPRYGSPVEINALWYNAVCYSLELAEKNNDKKFVKEWKPLVGRIGESFVSTFWNDERGYLADVFYQGKADESVRPNQVIAVALPYSPLSKEMKKSVLSLAKRDLVTPRGLRTLSPRNERYEGIYEGNETQRERAIHQGSVFPWLLGFFTQAYLNIHQHGGLSYIRQTMEGFEEEMTHHCIGTLSELYNGNPPHTGKGAISQAWNIGEILRAYQIIGQYEE
ncbi:MAG TPA: amylo-alpha-1,6-glucosidase [Prolixibacteraceae bacterium]|nr:amylo-alpha-1,6-glucosidase [Prolixibacteraceae bacterium]